MNALARVERRWSFVAQALLAVLVLAGASYALGLTGSDTEPTTSKSAAGSPARIRVEHARWRVRAFPSGLIAPASKKRLAPVRAAHPRLIALVTDVHDSLLIERERLPRTAKRHFSPRARRALLAADLGLPAKTTWLRVVHRGARIAIQAPGARRAVATVGVRVAGKTRQRSFRVRYRSTLWLERAGRGWRAIAFELKGTPLR